MVQRRHAARQIRSGIIVWAILSLVVSACGVEPTATPTPAAGDPRSATLSDLAGEVAGRSTRTDPLAPVSLGFQLNTGGQVQTGDESRARLDFSDRSILRLSSNSAYTLEEVETESDGSVTARVQLTFGKIWVSVFGGAVEVETPVGVASVRGSFAVFQYAPGDPNDPNDDLLLVDCLEGTCTANNQNVNEQLGNLERLVLNSQTSLRQTLSETDVLLFLFENPESNRLVPTLTAAPPATATRTLIAPTATATATRTATALPTLTHTPAPSATVTPTLLIPVSGPTATPPAPTPAFRLLGTHRVQTRETFFCIGRGYGVLPAAIALANNRALNSPLTPGERLSIPAIQWDGIPSGPVCPPQFNSPFPGLPASTATSTATFVPSSTPTVPPNAPTSTPVAATNTLVPTAPITPPPTLTSTPIPPTFTLTLSPTPTPDRQGPSLSNFVGSLNFPECSATFSVDAFDANGISAAYVTWTKHYSDTTPFGTPITTTLAGPSTGGLWSGTSGRFTIFLPPSGYIEWSVTAADQLGNLTDSGSSPQTIPFDSRVINCG
jgi:hypothetical protein